MASYAYKGGYTTYNGVNTPQTEGWSKPSYASDHAYQPVAIDAEGRRKPAVISYTPTGKGEYYVKKTEIVEHVPFVSTGYKQTSAPVRVEVIRDYGDHHADQGKWNRPSSSPEKWGKPSSPVRYHADEEKWNRHSSPVRYHAEDKWNKPSSPVRYRVEEKWNRPSSPADHERPQQVEEFITKIQTQASQQQQPSKFSPLSPTHWRETPNFSPPAKTGYGHQGDLSGKEWQKPSVNFLDPTPKPSYGSWSKGQGANLGQPTSDINTAMQYLTEAAKPLPKRNTYSETIDSREAQRRYGGLNVASRPRDKYAGTIDSREAARKYGGATV